MAHGYASDSTYPWLLRYTREIVTGKRKYDTMAKKRGNNEGSITRRPDGRWMAQVTIGRDPATGKPRRATFSGKTRQEVADKLTKALRDKQQGTFVAPHKLTLGEWLDTWLQEYKKPHVRPSTFDSYEMLVRYHLKPL